MNGLAATLLGLAIALAVYAYVGYPALLKLVSVFRRQRPLAGAATVWPMVSITIPVYNEAETIAATLERLLELDYPADRRQIVVVSDASNDGTDDIVRGFASRGVELVRLTKRGGKTAAENAAQPLLHGEIVINTDASILLAPDAIRHLVAAFSDPTVGVASGRDVSVARLEDSTNRGESGYVGYEMWVRDLETRVEGIVGASGCLYAIRADLHRTQLPPALSRDFSAALIAREHGLRAVSVPAAVCYVPRTGSLRKEFQRKVRTMTRGMQTLLYKRHLMQTGSLFGWMLFSHKVCRWLVPWAGVVGLVALGVLCEWDSWARWVFGASLITLGFALVGWLYPEKRAAPRFLSLPAYVVSGNLAAIVAVLRTIHGDRNPTWEPTRRETVTAPRGV